MDIYDPNIMGPATQADGTSTPNTATDAPKTELDQNVEKLVGNISSWWYGIAKKSQDSLAQARKEMESQGGIVNYAKAEYAKLESSIGEAQKRARDQSQTGASSAEALGDPSMDDKAVLDDGNAKNSRENSKGKQRAVDDERASAVASGKSGENLNQGPTLGASVTSLFSKLTSDPRLVQLQHSLTSTLQSVSQGQSKEDEKAMGATTNPIKIQESLSKLSLTIQSHLPHLDLKDSQQLATKYLQATESFAKEMQADMKEFVGELVRVVPPEGEEIESNMTKAVEKLSDKSNNEVVTTEKKTQELSEKVGKTANSPGIDAGASVTTAGATDAPEEEDDFAWDEDDEEAAASTEAISAAAVNKGRIGVDPTTTVYATHSTLASAETPAQKKDDESDQDSDWE
ncbi:uncharacterized protein MEPE_01270 [Melanopsichium pennsylvanicum]|uniref:BSD domain-containing protein n=2 Tax=Melanopsichium pennsylvanicum TaxID=63383 RepID=A0AAJ4XHN4_9BASI|nr:putative protein [Melanopsichium pennsylvanicum 4]SNX82564.1 uncharacterized protein MEPE_01270 [Melanopsichium pennsylvanicum]